jgi:SAM-dependent methyltransferase
MLLTITTTRRPATDLGFLLHKHPDRCQHFELAFGAAHIFYPEASAERCTAALLLDVDPVGLARGRSGPGDSPLAAYVSDRPYVASSFLSVAIADVFRTALAGRCDARPELAATAIPLEARLSTVPCRGGEPLLRRLFEPLGYAVACERYPLDPRFPEWGESPYFGVTLTATRRLAELLGHLYVLIPVLDAEKHYYVGVDEVEKLLRHGANWLAAHPERELIVHRYLLRKRDLTRAALDRLLAEEGDADTDDEPAPDVEAAGSMAVPFAFPEIAAPSSNAPASSATRSETDEGLGGGERVPLNEQRMNAVLAVLRASGAKRVIDLGCGEGRLLRALLDDRSFTRILGMDVSHRALERAAARLRLERLPERQRERIGLIQGSLLYRDARLKGFDAAAVVEVIEHLDPPRLAAFEQALFAHARPGTVVLTTPNAEYNVRYGELRAGEVRHEDHRFEWTRAQFREWAEGVAARHGYDVRFLPVGPEDAEVGAPTQMAVFAVAS